RGGERALRGEVDVEGGDRARGDGREEGEQVGGGEAAGDAASVDAGARVERAAQREEAQGEGQRPEGRAGAELEDGAGDRDRGVPAEGDARALDAHEPPFEGHRP